MPPRRPAPQVPQPVVEFKTSQQIDRSIASLRVCLDEIRALDQVDGADDRVQDVERRIRDTIARVFGTGSRQFRSHQSFRIDQMPPQMVVDSPWTSHYDPRPAAQAQFLRSIPGAVTRLEGLVRDLELMRPEVQALEAASAHYETACVCLNGHVVNSQGLGLPSQNKRHCPECGRSTIQACDGCGAPIQGQSIYEPVRPIQAPRYCTSCGKPYPWTAARIEAAKALAEELGLSETEEIDLKAAIDQVANDSPQTTVGALRIRKLTAKMHEPMKALFMDALAKVVVEVAARYVFS